MGWISALTSLGGTLVGGIGSIMTNKRQVDEAARQHGATNAILYEQLYQDPTKRADFASAIGQTNREMKAQQDVLAAKNKITGGTIESENAQRAAQAGVVGDVIEGQMARQEKRNDLLRGEIMNEKLRNDAVRNEFLNAQMGNWMNLLGNSIKAFGGFEKSGDGDGGKAKSESKESGQNGVQNNDMPLDENGKLNESALTNEQKEALKNSVYQAGSDPSSMSWGQMYRSYYSKQ